VTGDEHPRPSNFAFQFVIYFFGFPLSSMENTSIKVTDFRGIRLRLASPDEILAWSHGEITKPETINYRTQRAEKDGLFCERIFGPEKDWECYCGKYRRIRFQGIVCDKCGVEVTRTIVRRERMGHIILAVPVAHIWFLRGVPSRIGMMLDIPVQQLERVSYFNGYIITRVHEEARKKVLAEIEREFKTKSRAEKTKARKTALVALRDKRIEEVKRLQKYRVLTEPEYFDLSLRYAEILEADTGARALRDLLVEIDLETFVRDLERQSDSASPQIRRRLLRRIRFARGMLKAEIRPEWMILTALPVLPPDLRPMVQLDGGRYATSDLNDLYRRVINRNNRLKHLQELNAPEVIQRNEKRMLQEAVDALIDNSLRKGQTQAASTALRRPLKSLADMLKGKQGRFRQNLLGKRVDYSGRSVIVIGPELHLDQCGIPKKMALELFKPFVIRRLLEQEIAYNIRGASRIIDDAPDEVWAILEEVIADKYVLLNRAPTLHRLGIQAFKPILIEGEAIQIHALVCPAFNADFDGDQMAVHLPLSVVSQKEAKTLMLSSSNLLKPANGIPIAVPRHDIVLGCYWATKFQDESGSPEKTFSSMDEARIAHDLGIVGLKSKIRVQIAKSVWVLAPEEEFPHTKDEARTLVETSVGRILFNEKLPEDFPYINTVLNAQILERIIAEIFDRYGAEKTPAVLDAVKDFGFEYATKSGTSWGMDDLSVPKEKPKILERAYGEVSKIEEHYQSGLLTLQERRARVVEVWTRAKEDIARLVPETLPVGGSVFTIVDSGSRGSWSQPTQMMGMKGLVTNPAGQIMELPITSSFKEGFNVLEYFIATHGARKGASDTALRTATSGYLTRRLVDVAQDMIIRENDCQDSRGIILYRSDSQNIGQRFGSRLLGRTAQDRITIGRKTVVNKNQVIDNTATRVIEHSDLEEVSVRSPMTCRVERGICQTCYGWDLGINAPVAIGEAVGVIAAQAIGEPGTQLTMRTFHTGGVASGGDITQGLPRVEELFEARPPKGKTVISEVDGVVEEVSSGEKGERVVTILVERPSKKSEGKSKDGRKTKTAKARSALRAQERKIYNIPPGPALFLKQGEAVVRGARFTDGSVDLKELFEIAGARATERYIIKEVQKIYVSEGAIINDKHIEVIVRKMFSRFRIRDAGGTGLTSGEVIDRAELKEANRRAADKKKESAVAHQILLGITKVSLSTESFLASASFQETARVLIGAAVDGRVDHLRALKENVIIGRLIPAGTGIREEEQTIEHSPTEERRTEEPAEVSAPSSEVAV